MKKLMRGAYKPRVRKGHTSRLWYGRCEGFSVYAYRGFHTWEGAMEYALNGDYKRAERLDYQVSRNRMREDRR